MGRLTIYSGSEKIHEYETGLAIKEELPKNVMTLKLLMKGYFNLDYAPSGTNNTDVSKCTN